MSADKIIITEDGEEIKAKIEGVGGKVALK